jgi:hypothetical protein
LMKIVHPTTPCIKDRDRFLWCDSEFTLDGWLLMNGLVWDLQCHSRSELGLLKPNRVTTQFLVLSTN